MKGVSSWKRQHRLVRAGIFLVIVAVIVGMVGCGGNSVVKYDLTIASSAGGSVTAPGEGTSTYDEGGMVNLLAEPDEGYEFVNWTGDVDTVANANAASTTITMNDNYSVTANFNYVMPRMVIELDFLTFWTSLDFQAAVGHQNYMDTIADRVLAETDDYEISWNVFYRGTENPLEIYSLVRDGIYDIGV